MQKRLLLLGAALVLTSFTSNGSAVFATTLERGNFSQWSENRVKKRQELRRERVRTNTQSNDSGFFGSLFRFQRRRWSGDRPSGSGSAAPAKPEFYNYQPVALVALKDERLTGEVSENSYSRWVFDTLRVGSKPRMRAEAGDRKAILAFYKQRKFEPVWVGEFGLNMRAKRLIDALSRAHEDGLMVSRYLPHTLTSFRDIPEELFDDPRTVAELEVGLTAKALKFARHASGGQVDPNKIGRSFDLAPPKVAPAKALEALAGTLHPEEYLDALHPTHPVYLKLKARLARERGVTGDDQPEPISSEGGTIRYGRQDPRVPLIRARLQTLGFLQEKAESNELGYALNSGDTEAAETPDPYLFDQALSDAVRAFQGSKRLSRDGIVGRRTISALNGQSNENLGEKIELNMERMRWLTRNLGQRHIFVNQAAYMAEMMDNGRKIHQMRVIVGKPKHPTPMFSDEMETVVFNPYWNVPRSIIGAEYMPRLWNDPGYLDRKGFEVIDRRGKKVSSYNVDWWSYSGKTLPYNVRQPPSRGNALGEIKFLFPNKHAVYMHDTPKRSLFNSAQRAYSHGCVRIQDPRKFAQIVLGWSANKVNGAVEAGQNRPVDLSRKIPVHMTYFTMWPDDSGKLTSRADFYKRDSALKRALSVTRVALR
ncbi:MAG: L,D-transpeptidase family protein [Alphaproteobacteria bacterium]|nr:L,D-transpeptidase family protein [Alphaproteobacteria bacterium]